MSRQSLLAAVLLASAAAMAATADEASHTVLLGIGGGPVATSEAGADPEVVARLLASAAYGYRASLNGAGFAAVSASADAVVEDASYFETHESLTVESRLDAGPGELDGLAGARGSFFGDEPYVLANARLGYRLQGDGLRPGAWLLGSLDIEPETSEDRVGGGLRVGLLDERSIRLGFDASIEGLFESWYETDVYNGAGTPSGDKRRDAVVDLQIRIGGLAGYFVEWDTGIQATARFSTANRVLGSGSVDSDSESRIGAMLWAAMTWNPDRRLAVELELRGERSWYLGREALSDSGSVTGDRLRTLDLAGSLRVDWLLGGSVYFVLEGRAGDTLANDAAEESWSAEVRAGLEVAL